MQNASAKFSVQFRGSSTAIGQIAFDFASYNLYWNDFILNLITMKPAYNYKGLLRVIPLTVDLENYKLYWSYYGGQNLYGLITTEQTGGWPDERTKRHWQA